jgi:hypothetical protein
MKFEELRPRVIKDSIQRRNNTSKRMNEILRKRGDLILLLDEEYGYKKTNGIDGIGTVRNPEYVAVYNRIRTKYDQLYENESKINTAQDDRILSVWEYLLLDNLYYEEKEYLLDAADKYEDVNSYDFLK